MPASKRRPARETTGRVDASRRRASSRRRARGSGARSEKKASFGSRRDASRDASRDRRASRDTDARARYSPAARCLGGRAVRVCALAAGSLASRPPFPRRVMMKGNESMKRLMARRHSTAKNVEISSAFSWVLNRRRRRTAAANENAHTACSDRTTIPLQDGRPFHTPRHYRIPVYT